MTLRERVAAKLPRQLNPFTASNPMSWEDAAKISLVLTAAFYFIYFLPKYALWSQVTTDLGQFLWETLQFLGAGFFANFIGLTGLVKLTTKQAAKHDEKGAAVIR